MIDSTNPRSMADNIRKLWEKFKSISGDLLPSRSTATTGQILKLTGENKIPGWADEYSYTPPAYSETEVNTGQKWIDGKDIYCIAAEVDIPDDVVSGTVIDIVTISIDKLIFSHARCVYSNRTYSTGSLLLCNLSTGKVTMSGLSGTYASGKIYAIVYYTKPDPAPETRDDDTPEEVKETKTRKKTTK